MTAGLKLSQVFPAIKQDLMEHGWHKGSLFRDFADLVMDDAADGGWRPVGPRCLDGSRQIICQFDMDLDDEVDELMGLVMGRRGWTDFVDFNDDSNTTFNDIMEFLDECEVEAKERERDA